MAERNDALEATSEPQATDVAIAKDEATGETVVCETSAPPVAESAPTAPPGIEPAVEAVIAALSSDVTAMEPTAETTLAEAELKLPPVAQLAEPAPSIAPPPFLRERKSRPISVRPGPASKIDAKKPPAAPVREKARSRFPLLAATLALAAGLGGAAGAVGISALISPWIGASAAATPTAATVAEVQAIKGLVAQLGTELAALKTAVEQTNKLSVAQFGKVSERLDRAERAQAEPAAKLAKFGEALERIEKRVAPPAAPAQADVTGSVTHPPAPEAKPKPAILDDYVVRRVFDGVALIEGRRGIVEVEPGTSLPGAGRVEEIRRQDGRWVVVTTKGLIVPPR
jgi:hypothetical protein